MATKAENRIRIALSLAALLATAQFTRRLLGDFTPATCPDLRTADISGMSMSGLLSYVFWPNGSSCHVAQDFGGDFSFLLYNGNTRFRTGQKSVCMDQPWRPVANNCLVYSFGVDDEWSFAERMEQFGCQVYAFDPTMFLGDHQHSAGIRAFRMGIGAEDTDRDPVSGWKLRRLESIYAMFQDRHGQVPIDVLTIDVEHAEWDLLPQLMASGVLDRVRQLSLSVHFFEKSYTVQQVKDCLKVLHALEHGGMIRFASRPNLVVSGRHMAGIHSFTNFEMSFYNSKFKSAR